MLAAEQLDLPDDLRAGEGLRAAGGEQGPQGEDAAAILDIFVLDRPATRNLPLPEENLWRIYYHFKADKSKRLFSSIFYAQATNAATLRKSAYCDKSGGVPALTSGKRRVQRTG